MPFEPPTPLLTIDPKGMKGNVVARQNAVWIRKSSDEQDFEGQRNNVAKGLKAKDLTVPDAFWFIGTVSRRLVIQDDQFQKLLALVEANAVDTIFIEKQSRIGTTDSTDLFSIIRTLRDHQTKLVELASGKDLTEEGLPTEIENLVGSHTNRKQLEDTANFSLRSKINHFEQTASWPTGSQPFGYGKQCLSPTGTVLWEFEPSSQHRGQMFVASADGELVAGKPDQKILRKDRNDIIKLIPSRDAERVQAVQLTFDWFVREGLSQRAIALRLNKMGFSLYGKPFRHSTIAQILSNPAYVGEIHYGKKKVAAFKTFDKDGNIEDVEGASSNKVKATDRPESERMVKKDVHEPLVDRRVWAKAQARLAKDKTETTGHASRNEAYYLKPILYCGHCGKQMSGRTDNGDSIHYVCSSYQNGKQTGEDKCGYHRIKHDDAEQMLLAHLREQQINFEELQAASKVTDLRERLDKVMGKMDVREEAELFETMVDAFVEYAGGEFASLSKKERKAAVAVWEDPDLANLPPAKWTKLTKAIIAAEKKAAAKAKQKYAELSERLVRYTKAGLEASELQKPIITAECDQLEAEMRDLKPKTVPVSQRLDELEAFEEQQREERQRLLTELATTPQRERGEAFRRLFDRVTLFWSRERKEPEPKPGRPRKTNRQGRWSYTLETAQTQYKMSNPDAAASR